MNLASPAAQQAGVGDQIKIAQAFQRGSTWFADSNVSGSGDGRTWAAAFKIITEAVSAATAGDTTYLFGSFSEVVTCSKAGISFIGAGTNPKSAIWTAPTVAASFCLSPAACRIRGRRSRTASSIPASSASMSTCSAASIPIAGGITVANLADLFSD